MGLHMVNTYEEWWRRWRAVNPQASLSECAAAAYAAGAQTAHSEEGYNIPPAWAELPALPDQ